MPAAHATEHATASIATAVTSVLRLVGRGAPLDACLDALCDHLEPTCRVDATIAFTLHDGHWQVAGQGSLPAPLGTLDGPRLVTPGSLVEQAATDRQPLVCEDLAALDDDDRDRHRAAIDAGLRGMLFVPVIGAGDELHGLLGLATTAPRSWTDATIALARAFADLAALVLERHHAQARADRAHARTAQLSHRLASILDAVPTPTFELDHAGRVTRWNRAASIVVGWRADDLVGRPLTTMGRGWSALGARLEDARRGVATTSQVEAARRDGTELVLEVRLNPLIDDRGAASIIGTVTDLTDRLAMETAIRRSQRMESLGQFAGGIAHDFGNILAAIAGFADLLELQLPDDQADARADAAEIRRVAERGRALTERLLDFAHSRPTAPTAVDMAAGVRGLQRVLAGALPSGCQLVLDLEDVPEVTLGHGQLDQILLNLVANAGDAMPDGGTVTVAVRSTGDEVVLEVGDQGRGIPQPLLDRVFEPFFTTKGARGGTGLGLANVYAIVRGAGGQIEVTSRVQQGTRFHVQLPARVGEPPDAPPEGARRVLVVDPETVSRQVLRTALSEAGYRVLAVSHAEQVDLADVARTDPVSVVVCPATGGTPADRPLATLLHRIRQLHPEVALVGLGERGESSRDPGVTSIARPYIADQVVAAVRRASGGQPSDPGSGRRSTPPAS